MPAKANLMGDERPFEIPEHPSRNFRFRGGVEYEGGSMFVLTPADAEPGLEDLLIDVLEAGPYRYGDFLNLPMPLYLVKDDETGDVFRVSIRDGSIRFHVLPETESAGLRALHDRLVARSDSKWEVRCTLAES